MLELEVIDNRQIIKYNDKQIDDHHLECCIILNNEDQTYIVEIPENCGYWLVLCDHTGMWLSQDFLSPENYL